MKFEYPILQGEEYLEHFAALPDYKSPAYCTMIVDCRNDAYLMDIVHTYAVDFWEYRRVMRREYGFVVVAENHIGENHFVTLKDDERMVTLIFIPSRANTKIIVEPLRELPKKTTEPYERICSSELVTVGHKDNGSMTFVLRLADGKFILVDGGWQHETADTVLEVMRKLAPDPQNLTIAAWIITHPHGDHIGAFIGMAEKHLGEVTIESLIYNFPCREQGDVRTQKLAGASDGLERRIKEKYSDIPVYKPHPGCQFQFANLKIEILSTHELHYPPMPSLKNDCCLFMRWEIDGQVIMFPADSSSNSNHTIAQMYGTYLRCDILQADHHGNFGGTMEINTMFSPHTVIYLCPESDFHDRFRFSDYNMCLFNNPNYKESIVVGSRIVAMPLPYEAGTSYIIEDIELPK